jgi:predicted dehydrogenase/nucleoside-diphosphate-sugar epimerase
MAGREIRTGFVGAGYIASWHAEALASAGARLVAVCDPALSAAEGLAGRYGAQAYRDLGQMLAEAKLDAVHILTPPSLHAEHALAALAAGAHVLVEKPFALTSKDAAAMVAAAKAAGKVIAVNHNFLTLPAYARLRAAMAAGVPGKLDSVDIRWRFPLAPLRSGPFGLWMLRAPQNLLFELGPHLFAFAVDLLGPLTEFDLRLSKPIRIPGGVAHHQGWQIRAKAGDVDVTLHLSLVEGAEDRSVELRGVGGIARLDYGADALVIERANASDIVVNPLRHQLGLAWQHGVEGARNAARQLASLNRKSPYGLGFLGATGLFYDALRGGAMDARLDGGSAVEVIRAIEAVAALIPAQAPVVWPAPPVVGAQADMLVIGGTGFVGRDLTRALVAKGHRVRVLSRGRSNPFADLGDAVELVPVAMTDVAGLTSAMAGIDTVFHLARSEESSWEAYLQNDVAVTEGIAGAVLAAGVRRLVYTGTIASYDASDPSRIITEETEFGPMQDRNLYARSKAECEARLLALHRDKGLPLVIARPGIVVGPGGPLQHWGIGRWHGAGAVRIWGNGRNKLPFVLNDDVADGLIAAAEVPGIEGQSFNLVGGPVFSAREYFAAIRQVTGTFIRVVPGNLTLFYLGDLVKYALKRFALRKRGLSRPLLLDWKSRAHLSPFSNEKARRVLGWQPEDDPKALAALAIDHPELFGF